MSTSSWTPRSDGADTSTVILLGRIDDPDELLITLANDLPVATANPREVRVPA
jgi:hypothetical protein